MLGLARLLLVVLLSILPLFLVLASSSSDPPRSAPGSHPSTTATVSKQQPKSAGSDDPRTKEEASVSSRSLGVADRDDSSRTSSQEASISSKSSTANNDPHDDADMMIKIVFSDVDGTLVHYDSRMETAHSQGSSIQHEVKEDVPTLVHLPPSATGTQGVISARTLQLCRNIRAQGIPLVLVSGMRTSTLLQRLPYLPKADAYCSEGGSRIFYPSTQPQQKGLQVVPVSFHGATPQDLEPFHLVEDLEWRRQIVKAIGLDGFIGNDITDLVAMEKHPIIPLESRSGPLWELANRLRKDGYILDLKGYAACFRVNRKQQPSSLSSVRFDDLLSGNDVAIPLTISTSTNLGCVDFYPAMSGKKNCCLYLANNFLGSSDQLATHGVCLCDDDNDLDMALACRHAYIPSVTSDSMAKAIQNHPTRFTTTFDSFNVVAGTASTEAALEAVLTIMERRAPR